MYIGTCRRILINTKNVRNPSAVFSVVIYAVSGPHATQLKGEILLCDADPQKLSSPRASAASILHHYIMKPSVRGRKKGELVNQTPAIHDYRHGYSTVQLDRSNSL